MFFGIQIVGVIFGLAMLYLSYVYFKKKDFTTNDFILWLSVWIAFLLVVIFPGTVRFLLNTLNVEDAVTLFTIFGFMFIFGMVVYLYRIVRKSQKKIESVVIEIAKRTKIEK